MTQNILTNRFKCIQRISFAFFLDQFQKIFTALLRIFRKYFGQEVKGERGQNPANFIFGDVWKGKIAIQS